MNDNVLTKDCGVLADAMQSVRRSLKMADRLADGYIPPMGGERYLTDRDLARRLHVSRRTLQQYRHEGILPYFLFGGKTLYRESDIQKVLERNYRKAKHRETDTLMRVAAPDVHFRPCLCRSAVCPMRMMQEQDRRLFLGTRHRPGEPFAEQCRLPRVEPERQGYDRFHAVNLRITFCFL